MPAGTRPTPEQLLKQVQAEEEFSRRGRLKVFLGYAAGVGKSFRMLDEGRRRQQRGQDIVIGAAQPQGSVEMTALIAQLPSISEKQSGEARMMDVAALIRRRPEVCLVDGLAYDNPPGSANAHRWQDVEQLLDAGISVIATINVQYVDERRERVEQIRGKAVSTTVPESFLRQADEIVVVDAPAEFCSDEPDAAMLSTPGEKEQKLSQLREIALLLAADVVDHQLESYLERNGLALPAGMQERILVCVTPRTNAARMIERARIIRDRFHGSLFVIYVGQSNLTADDQAALERNLALARSAGGEVKLLEGEDPVAVISTFAQEHGITQIFIGHSLADRWWTRFMRTAVDRLIRCAEGMDVKLFPH